MKTNNKITLSKMNWMLFLLSKFKIPLIGFVRPKLIHLDDEIVKAKIKLNRKNKNHLKSMYFGALAVGADVSAGIHVFYFMEKYNKKISFAFKSMDAQFLKRAESDVVFSCDKGREIEELVLKSIEDKQRYNHKVPVEAFDLNNVLVATFEMEISLKVLN